MFKNDIFTVKYKPATIIKLMAGIIVDNVNKVGMLKLKLHI